MLSFDMTRSSSFTGLWNRLVGILRSRGSFSRSLAGAHNEALRRKYVFFQKLLSENNRVLSLMADMEEKLSGEFLFDKQYIITSTREVMDSVANIIRNLDAISPGKYRKLNACFQQIRHQITAALSPRKDIRPSEITLPLADLHGGLSEIAGGKMARLGEMRNRINLPVPDGFVITAYASKLFLDTNKLGDKIREMLHGINSDDLQTIEVIGASIRKMIAEAPLPDAVSSRIHSSIDEMKADGQPLFVSVRSSALLEDGDFNFAGQYATILNVSGDDIISCYKEVVSSLFTPRAIFYYKTKGLDEDDLVMAVGVVRMIDTKAAGVMYTADPNDPNRRIVIINAVCGLGKAVVDGLLEPDFYAIEKSTATIVEHKISHQTVMLVCGGSGLVIEQPVPAALQGQPVLTDQQIGNLYEFAIAIERHYGAPQDIEWAVDRQNRIYLLQSRLLKIVVTESDLVSIPRRMKGHAVLLDKGIIACKGIGYGKAFVVTNNSNLSDFPQGAVLVARHTSARYVTIMKKAAAIVTDVGGVTGHMASLSREYGVPTILDTGCATSAIAHGQDITVDAYNANVYAGRIDELLSLGAKKKKPVQHTPLLNTLRNVLTWIAPLNLADPDSRDFRPEACKTIHDITRFAHERVMADMFLLGDGYDQHGGTIALGQEGPLDAHLIDMDGCVVEGLTVATPEDIHSIPFCSFLKGIYSMKWPEPRPADAQGVLGMMMHHATKSEDETYDVGRQSFALIARNYMNFSIRLGYHFSMIEAYAGENRNDNYIRFFFKGGGAAVDRRLRRLKVISEIFKALDFRIAASEDVINASLTKYDASDIMVKLEILGKLTVYTKQLDLVMYNDALVDHHTSEFIGQHIRCASR
jgi:pyruvate, water dikinase